MFLHELLRQVDAQEKPSPQLLAQVFRALKKSKVRRPDLYVLHGPSHCESLSQVDKYAFYEQIFTGALDYGDLELARVHLDLLKKQFAESSRVKRLEGMMAEAAGDYDAAIQLYDDILKENKANLIVMKRKVAALRSQGKNVLAVEALHDIVKVFQSDAPSWLELADIHLSLCDYQSAAFCYEEVVLLMPSSAPMYIRLAETLYTIGGGENLVKARQYFSISLTHLKAQKNSRAVYGLLATCREILALPSKKVPEGEVEVTTALQDWCLEHLGERKRKEGVVGLVATALTS